MKDGEKTRGVSSNLEQVLIMLMYVVRKQPGMACVCVYIFYSGENPLIYPSKKHDLHEHTFQYLYTNYITNNNLRVCIFYVVCFILQ